MSAAESSAKDNCKTSDGNQEVPMFKVVSVDGKSLKVRFLPVMPAAESSAKDNCKTSDGNQGVPMVKFVSIDGKSFSVEEKVARKFTFIDSLIECAIESDEPIPLEIESYILTKMLKYAERHVNDLETECYDSDDDTFPRVPKRTDDIDEWDNELISVDTKILFLLINSARDVGMIGLKYLGIKKLASLLKGKTPEEMAKILNIPRKGTNRRRSRQ